MAKNFDVVKYINEHTEGDGKCRLKYYNEDFFNYLDNVDPESITDREKEALEKVVAISWVNNGIDRLPENMRVLTSLTKLDLGWNYITDISPLRELTSLTELYLFDNQIKDISPLSGLTSLTKLYLRDNQIKDISPLSGLTSLTGLYLRNNQITNISHLSGLTSLTELDLRSNQINDISSLSGLTSLKHLGLSGNQINDICHLSGLTSLTELDLKRNQIKDISSLRGLTSLTYLYLGGNQINDISPLSGLTRLTYLYFGGSQINDISPLSGLTSLTSLNLYHNQINDISSLSELKRLTNLNLGSNQIKDISPLRELNSLTTLILLDNQIKDISPLSELTSLTELNLGSNQIEEIEEGTFSGLTSLTYLNLSYNQIKDISPLSGLTNLTYLNLKSNQITDISPLSELTRLTKLDLGWNHITDISPLSELTSLTYLDLGGLKLKSIPDSIIKTALDNELEFYYDNKSHDKGINLTGTTLAEQDISMFFNREALMEYFNAKEKFAINEVKVIFLGNGGAGKTHTVQRLLNGGEDVDAVQDETIGIQISNYQTKTKDGADMTLRLWDFGGQNYMHSMHRCFLTSNTIYVVVLYGREGNLTSNAKFWLENIKSFAPNSQAIIAVNLWEGEVKPGINTEELREKYGDLYIDTVWYFARKIKPENAQKNGKQFEELMDAITETAKNMCEKQKTSKASAEVKKCITKEFKKKKSLTKEEYLKICEDASKELRTDDKIDDKRAYRILSICNDTGISVSRIKRDSKGNAIGVEDDTYTVLNPDWLFKGIYRIIATQKTLLEENSNGQVSTKTIEDTINDSAKSIIPTRNTDGEPMEMEISLPKLTGNEEYASEQCEAVLRIMRQYNMSADVGKNVEFIPAICSEKQPQALICNEKDKNNNNEPIYKEVVCLEYKYTYLPTTVIHQLMLNSLKNTEEGRKMNVMNPWQTGAEIIYGDNVALIKIDEIRHTLIVNIYSTQDKDPAYTFIKSLHSMINNINNGLGISAISYLVVPSNTFPDKKASFPLDTLITSLNSGNIEMQYSGNGVIEKYKLYDLLDKRYPKDDVSKMEKAIRERDIDTIIKLVGNSMSQINIDIEKLICGNDQSTTQTGNNNTIAGGDVIINSHNKTEIHEGINDISDIIKTLAKHHEQVEEQTLNTMLEIIKSNKELSAKVTAVPNIESAGKESKFDLIMDILLDVANVFEKPLSPVQWIKSTKGVVDKLKTLFPEHPNP